MGSCCGASKQHQKGGGPIVAKQKKMSDADRDKQRKEVLAATEKRVSAQEKANMSKGNYVDMKFKQANQKAAENAQKDNAFKGNTELQWQMK